jgi:CxxC-x17-CxxC domain-containing protein
MKNFKNRDDKRGGFGGNRGGRDDRGGRGDDKPVFFGKSRGGDRSTDREQRMFKAICSDCKKSCEVPFKPSSDKPVFCRDCFSAKRDRETREYKASLANGEPKKFGQDNPALHSGSTHSAFVPVEAGESTKKQLAEMNARIDKLTALVEKSGGS